MACSLLHRFLHKSPMPASRLDASAWPVSGDSLTCEQNSPRATGPLERWRPWPCSQKHTSVSRWTAHGSSGCEARRAYACAKWCPAGVSRSDAREQTGAPPHPTSASLRASTVAAHHPQWHCDYTATSLHCSSLLSPKPYNPKHQTQIPKSCYSKRGTPNQDQLQEGSVQRGGLYLEGR